MNVIISITPRNIFNFLYSTTIETSNMLYYMNRNLIGIFMFEKVIKKTLNLEKQLNVLMKEVELLDNCEVKTFLIRRFSNIKKIIQTILKDQDELESNSLLINSYFSIKNKLIKIIDSNEKDEKTFLECLNEQKVFEKDLFVMGRYVDVDIKESLQYLKGIIYLKWEKLQHFVSKKQQLLEKFELKVKEYFSKFPNNDRNNLFFLLEKLLKLKNDVEIEILIISNIVFFPEVEVIHKNFQQIFIKTDTLIKKVRKNIKNFTKNKMKINEYENLGTFEEQINNICTSSLENNYDFENKDSEMDNSQCFMEGAIFFYFWYV
uniref:Uncharacterized protein n=1 Tax=Strongyloides stercoralis TaxID=6248 RepID=A0AAF5D7T7_STRER